MAISRAAKTAGKVIFRRIRGRIVPIKAAAGKSLKKAGSSFKKAKRMAKKAYVKGAQAGKSAGNSARKANSRFSKKGSGYKMKTGLEGASGKAPRVRGAKDYVRSSTRTLAVAGAATVGVGETAKAIGKRRKKKK